MKGSIERIKLIEAYANAKICVQLINQETEINTNDLDIYSNEYDSLFYYAQRKENLNDTTVSKIKHLGYSNLFELL